MREMKKGKSFILNVLPGIAILNGFRLQVNWCLVSVGSRGKFSLLLNSNACHFCNNPLPTKCTFSIISKTRWHHLLTLIPSKMIFSEKSLSLHMCVRPYFMNKIHSESCCHYRHCCHHCCCRLHRLRIYNTI